MQSKQNYRGLTSLAFAQLDPGRPRDPPYLHSVYSPSKSITESFNFIKRAGLWTDFWQLNDILNPLVGTNSLYGKRTVGFFSLASHALRACEARAVRAHKTLTPRVTDFFTDLKEKTDCFAVYLNLKMCFATWPTGWFSLSRDLLYPFFIYFDPNLQHCGRLCFNLIRLLFMAKRRVYRTNGGFWNL